MRKIVIGILLIPIILAIHSSFQTIAIITTNDIHGGAFSSKLMRTDTK